MTDRGVLDISPKEMRLIEALRNIGVPNGEVLLRIYIQDRTIVRAVIEDKKESIKL